MKGLTANPEKASIVILKFYRYSYEFLDSRFHYVNVEGHSIIMDSLYS